MRWLFLFILFFPLYFFRLYLVRPINIPDQAQIRLVGQISRQPYLKGSKQIIYVSQFLITTDRFPTFFYGQNVEVVGKVNKKVINRFQTQYSLNYPAISLINKEDGLINKIGFPHNKVLYKASVAPKYILANFREKLLKLFSQILPEPQASLMAGILLGAKKELPTDFYQNLKKTGTMHVVVASGYNISVIAGFLINVLVAFIERKKAIFFAIFGVFIYLLIAGPEPALIRAGIMASLAFGAQFFGREKNSFLSLAFAAILMLLVWPLIIFDIGFQLSFFATAGILFFYPKLKFLKLPILGDDLAVTLSAQIATLPLTFFYFGQFNLLSPLINALVLPTIPLIMVLGGLALVSGLIWLPLAQFIGWFVWLPLTYFVKIIGWFAAI